jgi:hypothetical protein
MFCIGSEVVSRDDPGTFEGAELYRLAAAAFEELTRYQRTFKRRSISPGSR